LNMIRVSAFVYDIVRGGVLVSAVLIDRAASLELFSNWLGFKIRRSTRAASSLPH